jgi:predicted acylesterase/phospholipase RssA
MLSSHTAGLGGFVGARTALAAILAVALVAGGCAGAIERNPLPNAETAQKATLPDMAGVRTWADEPPKDIKNAYRTYLKGVPQLGASAPLVDGRMQIDILALSGGGSDGAFGAGVLNGWTARGDRPEFEQVTGVSAGSIIAPFAYLGADYDDELKQIWTQYQTDQLVVPQIVTGLLGGEALADTGPLKKLIAQYIDRDFLKKVAKQYERGRLLTVGTTNLDAKRPVVWNMGAIARHYDNPAAVQLFRDVILASAAIPGLFPPVNIKVVSDGKYYDEMHVDGGVTRQIYVSSIDVPFKAFDVLYPKPPKRHIYLVHNGKMTPQYGAVKPSTFQIAGESINTLMLYQHKGDNYRIYRMALDGGADFNSVAIPPAFNHTSTEKFDLGYQRALFEEGIRVGKARKWSKKPGDVFDVPRVATPAAPAERSPPAEPAAAEPLPPPADDSTPAIPGPPPAVPNAPPQPVAMDRVSIIETATPR